MTITLLLLILNFVLINIGFLISFCIRYGFVFPERSFAPYKESFVVLSLLYISALSFFRVYKSRFKSSWDLFKRVFLGLLFGTLLSIAFVYTFRAKWGAFPTSIFILSFFVNLFLIFKSNQHILKAKKKIKKKVVIIGEGDIDDIVTKKADVQNWRIDEVKQLIQHVGIDEIIMCERIQNEEDMNLLMYLTQELKIRVVFSPSNYLALLPKRIGDDNSIHFLRTFIGKKADIEEFLIRSLDIIGSATVLLISVPVTILIALLIKISSPGPVLYKQNRVGKDGEVFTLYKFRTMIKDAEKLAGLAPALENDARVTRVGKCLRRTRLDELPQLFNVVKGQMSLVGPRPENLHRVKTHNALRELRLVVRPGVTGLAQIRSLYDLKPQHKIRYDYLYIQRRSLLLNLYILAKTIPVVLLGKGQ